MKAEIEEKNGLFTIRLDPENRDDTAFLHHFTEADREPYIILHRASNNHTSTLTIQRAR